MTENNNNLNKVDGTAVPINSKKKNKIRKRDDELWKGVLEEVFDDFLKFFIPDADQLFDLNRKLVFLDKEFSKFFPAEDSSGRVRFVDKLVRVHLQDGSSRFILVHVEIQGQQGDEDLNARMFRYFYLAREKHHVSITAFAILIDEVKSHQALPYQEEYLGTKLSYKFNTYKLLDQDEAELRANSNIFAVVALVVLKALKHKNVSDEELKIIKMDLVTELIKRKVSSEKYNAVMIFLSYYVNFKKPKMMLNFEASVEQLTGRTAPMTVMDIFVERGRNAEREKNQAEWLQEKKEIARNLKNKGINFEIISESTGLSIKEIESL